MENYERLIIDLLGDELTPRAKYEYVKMLIASRELYNNTKLSLEEDIEWFGKSNPRHIQAERTYDILTGKSKYEPDSGRGKL